MNNIPENILQQVADAAFLSSNGGMMGLLTCNKEKNHVFWHEERYERRAVIQHALENPAIAPFLASPESLPASESVPSVAYTYPQPEWVDAPEPAAQVPLGPEDVLPGSALRSAEGHWFSVAHVSLAGVTLINANGSRFITWDELDSEGWQINTSIPDTGRWDANAWRPCSKPGKEVAK